MRQPAVARGDNVVTKETRPERAKNRAVKARQRALGRELRRIYDEVTREPVPDDFLDLLKKIDDENASGDDR